MIDLAFGQPIKSACPTCAAERQDAEIHRKHRDAQTERQQRIARILGASCIPQRFADRTFVGYRATLPGQRLALGVCQAFADAWLEKLKAGASLVLTGAPGTGKTHLACALASRVMTDHLATVMFGTVATMLRHIKSTYRRDSERSEQQAIDDLTRPDLLILDEVGVQIGSEHEKLLMFEILNARYQDCRPTVLISNLSSIELEDYLGHRVMDRYRECGSVIGFDWPSHRGKRE